MSHQPATVSGARTGRRPFVVLGIVGLILVVALAGGWIYVKFRSDMAGLEGRWRQQGDAAHTFRFRANGNIDAWYHELPMGNFMTWQRDGRQITIRSTRGSDFVGQLGDGEIRGKETIHLNTGETVNTVDQVWRRE